MQCIYCGANVSREEKFCPNCGHRINQFAKSHNLIVIGNGFDMFLGLPSSFVQFFGVHDKNTGIYYKLNKSVQKIVNYVKLFNKKYSVVKLNTGIHISSNLVMKYIDVILLRRIMYNNKNLFFYNHVRFRDNDIYKLRHYVRIFERRLKRISFKKSDLCHVNFWAIYLILRKDNNDKLWKSIETEIYKFLVNKDSLFYIIMEHLYELITSKHYNNSSYNKDYLKNFNSYFFIYLFLTKYLIKCEEEINKLNSMHIVPINRYLVAKQKDKDGVFNNNNNSNFFKNEMCKYLDNQLSIFEEDLNFYLSNYCLKKYYNSYGLYYTDVGRNLLSCISNYHEFSLINFNYTKPLGDKLERDLYDKTSIHHSLNNINRNIHGVLIKDKMDYKLSTYTRHSLVIGVSDKDIDITSPFYIFTKNYRIMRLSSNKYENIFRDKNYIKNIEFFGQSFASADYSYFYSIFDEFNILHSKVKLIFYYADHGNKDDDECARDQMKKIDLLFYNYYLDKGKESKYSKELIHTLSLEGRLMIINLRDKINKYNYNDKRYIYPESHKDILRIHGISELKNSLIHNYTYDERYSINNIRKTLDFYKHPTLNNYYNLYKKSYNKNYQESNYYAKKILSELFHIFSSKTN